MVKATQIPTKPLALERTNMDAILAMATRTWRNYSDTKRSSALVSQDEFETKINIKMHDSILTIEYAEYTKSEAPKFTPSKTKANELMGWVAATNWRVKNKNEK